MKKINPYQFYPNKLLSRQRGISLLLTVVVLLGLTIIAITITNSNQTQSTLVRNNQFRLEAFNASYTEIDAQIDAINQRTLSSGPPTYVNVLISGSLNDRVEAGDSELELLAKAAEVSTDGDTVPTALKMIFPLRLASIEGFRKCTAVHVRFLVKK